MRNPRRFAAALLLVIMALCVPATARPSRSWTMAELTKEADLIVIARPTGAKKTGEHMGKENWQASVAEVITTFGVEAVLKGELGEKPLAVRHFVWEETNVPVANGPMLVSFEVKQDGPGHLLFLKKRADGGYEPLAGQMDPVSSCFILTRETGVLVKFKGE